MTGWPSRHIQNGRWARAAGTPLPGRPVRPWWARPAVHTGVAGAVAGYFLGHWLGNFLGSGYQQLPLSDSPDLPIVLGYLLAIAGWLAGLGVFNDPVRQILGRPAGHAETEATTGMARYFRYSLDHKVVGLQYLTAMLVYFCTAGLFAMAIRTELLSPVHHVFSSSTYVEIVSEHGTMMMMLMTSVVVGPFGNYLVPIMIGSKRVAFPRIEALSFWLTPAAFLILLSGILVGGFHFGWTNYAPGSVQDTPGSDAFAVAFGLMGLSIILAGFNLIVTVICYRAPGMTWGRLPMFVWSMLATSFLMVLAAPVLVGGMYMILTDRTVQTAFFADQLGGSSYLYQNLFWFFGHPEVYILALPGFGIVSEIIPVFCRKPLFGYKTAAAGMAGVTVLSFFVWQHHLFDSGINPEHAPAVHAHHRADLDPHRVHLPGRDGHVLEGQDPADRADAVLPRHVLQLPDRRDLRGVPVRRARRHHRARLVLRDGPLPLHDHGRADLRVHGRAVLLAAQDDRPEAEPAARQDPVLDHVRVLQLDVPAAVRGGPGRPAAPGLRVRAEPADPQRLGLGLGLPARRRHPDLRRQRDLVHRAGPRAGDRQPVAVPRPGMADRLAAAARQLRPRPGRAVRAVRVRHARRAPGGRPQPARGRGHRGLRAGTQPGGGSA